MRTDRETYWVIEHQNFGVLMRWEWRYYQGQYGKRKGNVYYPIFSWTVSRDNGIHYHTEEEAKTALDKVKESGRLGASKCYIWKME